MSEARTLLTASKVSQLRDDTQRIAVLTDEATVEDALKVMAERKILSAPVVVCPPDHDPTVPLVDPCKSADILGFIDIKNILNSFLEVVDLSSVHESKLLQRMRLLEEQGAEFGTKKIKDLKYMGTDGDFLHMSQAGTSLLELVLKGLLQRRIIREEDQSPQHVVHRVALFNNSGCITQIISQTDIILFLFKNKAKLGALGGTSVAELGLISNRVEGVHPETPAIEAMSIMSEKRLSSLAVLDANGKLLGNFSMSEMRTLMAEHFGALALPVGEFLAHEHKTEYVGFNRLREEGVEGTAGHKFVMDRVSRQRPRTPGEEVGQALVLARGKHTLVEVMDMLVRHRIHRVYLVDDNEMPIGIITCTDILRKVLELAN